VARNNAFPVYAPAEKYRVFTRSISSRRLQSRSNSILYICWPIHYGSFLRVLRGEAFGAYSLRCRVKAKRLWNQGAKLSYLPGGATSRGGEFLLTPAGRSQCGQKRRREAS